MPSYGMTPRLTPRPKYMKTSKILQDALIKNIRNPLLCVVFSTYVMYPIYKIACNAWIEKFGKDENSERLFFLVSVSVVHTFMYLTWNSIFLYWDRNGIFEKYKLDRVPVMGPEESLITRTWIEAFVGQVLTGPAVLYYLYPLFKYFGAPAFDAPLPSFQRQFLVFVFANVFNGWGFYWTHRLVHSKSLYVWIHKKHHMYKGTIGFAAEYAHPIEQVISNQGPTIGGVLLCGAHFSLVLSWLVNRLQQTYEGHSGYCFYGTFLHRIGLTNSDAAAYHDYHHTGNRGNFGGPAYLDHFFGTMDAWMELGGVEGYIAKKRSGSVLNPVLLAKYNQEKKKKK